MGTSSPRQAQGYLHCHSFPLCEQSTWEGNRTFLRQTGTGNVPALMKRVVWRRSPGEHKTMSAIGEEPSPAYKHTHTRDWGPGCRHRLETQAWTGVGMQPQAGDKGESATKAEFMIVTSISKRIPKTRWHLFCHTTSSMSVWGLKSAGKVTSDLILILTQKVQKHQGYHCFHSILLCMGI